MWESIRGINWWFDEGPEMSAKNVASSFIADVDKTSSLCADEFGVDCRFSLTEQFISAANKASLKNDGSPNSDLGK